MAQPLTRLQKKRLTFLLSLFLLIGGITLIGVSAYTSEISFYITPETLSDKHTGFVRLGGKVKNLVNHENYYSFVVYEKNHEVTVQTKGPLPPLFKENQGIVVEGRYNASKNIFEGDKIFAKHDEQYKPKCLT